MNAIKFRLSLMMFFQFFIWGGFFVAMGKYLYEAFAGTEGLDAFVGEAYATHNWAAIIAPLFVGLVADRFFNAERVNGVLHLIGAGCLWWAAAADTTGEMWWALMCYFMAYMPTLALVNAIAFNNIEDADAEFPAIRVWGTIGWIVAGLIVAQSMYGLVDFRFISDSDLTLTNFPLKMAAVMSVIYGIYSFTLPAAPPQARGKKVSLGQMLGLDALRLFKDRAFLVFALSSLLISIPLAFYYAQADNFISKVQFEDKGTAVMALGQTSEIVFMVLLPFFLRRLGVKWMLLVGMLAWVARYSLFALFPSSAMLLVLAIVLHGVSYDFFFVTGQLYTDKKAPREIRASAQSLIGLLTYGVGLGLGSKFGIAYVSKQAELDGGTKEGWLESAQLFWMMPAMFALGVAVLFFLAFWEKPKIDNAVAAEAA